jgi:hypothetical protein
MLRTNVNHWQPSACAAARKTTARVVIVDVEIKSPAEPGCKQILFLMQNYFASFAI